MSHIPASAMPHAHANGDTIDHQPPQPDQRQPTPEPTTATPLTAEAPATATGNRQGSEADRTARAAGQPEGTAARTSQPAVDGTVTAQDATVSTGEHRRFRLRSRAGAAAVVGVLALAGGIAAALFPRGKAKDGEKARKRRRKKS